MADTNDDPVIPSETSVTPEPNSAASSPPDSAALAPEPVAEAAPAASDTPPADVTGADAAADGLSSTLLEQFDEKQKVAAEPEKDDDAPKTEEAPTEEKKAEGEPDPKVEEPAAEDAPQTEEPAGDPEPEAPTLEAIDYFAAEGGITLPAEITMDDAQREEFATALDAFRADPKTGAQGLIDLHKKAMDNFAAETLRGQWDTFRQTNEGWKTTVMADPVLGGAGHDTAMARVAVARDGLVSTAKPGTPKYEADMAEFNDFVKVTGAGNHPAFLRLLHNASRFVREAPPPPPDGGVPPDLGKKPGGRKRMGDAYTHPSSNPDH